MHVSYMALFGTAPSGSGSMCIRTVCTTIARSKTAPAKYKWKSGGAGGASVLRFQQLHYNIIVEPEPAWPLQTGLTCNKKNCRLLLIGTIFKDDSLYDLSIDIIFRSRPLYY